jgi:pilus assembly protein CpaC
MKTFPLALAAAALALAGCHKDQGNVDAAVPPIVLAPAPPEPVAAAPQPTPATAQPAEPDPEPTPQEIAAFNTRVPK